MGLRRTVGIILLNFAPLRRPKLTFISEDYVIIIAALSKRRSGYTCEEIVKVTSLANGGGLTCKLDELEQCRFIRLYNPVKGRIAIFQLIVFYNLL